jgi:hypothetical protein
LASRSNTKFQKRQKELARANKRRDKDEKKQQRRSEKVNDGTGPPIEAMDPTDLGLPPIEEETAEEEKAGKEA